MSGAMASPSAKQMNVDTLDDRKEIAKKLTLAVV